MRVLVTGASGFVGSHVVRTLLERHYTVFGLTRGQRTIPEGATALIGDVEDVASLLNAIRTSNCHIVINCAGVYAWWLPDPSQFEVNATGVQNLLEALAETPAVALVHVSTVLAYGRCCAPKETFNESTPVGPHSSQYAASKHRGDLLAQQAFDAGRLRGCTLFLACCIGADPKLVDSNRDVMRILDLVQGAVPATIVSDVVFTYVHVRDAAEAIVRATERVSGRGGSGSSSGSGSGHDGGGSESGVSSPLVRLAAREGQRRGKASTASTGPVPYWRGSMFVFDRRNTVRFGAEGAVAIGSDSIEPIGQCEHCSAKTEAFINCVRGRLQRHSNACATCN